MVRTCVDGVSVFTYPFTGRETEENQQYEPVPPENTSHVLSSRSKSSQSLLRCDRALTSEQDVPIQHEMVLQRLQPDTSKGKCPLEIE